MYNSVIKKTQKMGKRSELRFAHERCTSGQEASEKLFNSEVKIRFTLLCHQDGCNQKSNMNLWGYGDSEALFTPGGV